MSIQVHLKGFSTKEFPDDVNVLDVAQKISPELAPKTVGAFINSTTEISDLRSPLKDNDQVEILSIPSKESLEVIRHSAAHVLAQAVQEIWPKTQVTIGPVIEDGFYYDFDHPQPFTDDDLVKIESKMKEIIARKLPVTKEVWPADKAIKTFKKMGELYKIELIEDIGESQVSVYKQGEWFDLCRGPHVQNLGQIGVIKLLSHSSCYWRADESRASLQRIYGTAFHSQKELDQYLSLLEEAKKRDHRKIGKEMNLFYFHEFSPGMPFFKPHGTFIYQELQNFLKEKYKETGYQEIITPQIYTKELFVKSGHFEFFKDNMYALQAQESQGDFLKPMNCPGHCLLYKSQKWSYKDLPWRVADFGRLHRYERSGTLHGLTRVRSFCQDDGHIFCSLENLQSEIKSFIQLLKTVYSSLGLTDYKIYLCTRPENKMGDESIWNQSEKALSQALQKEKIPFDISEGDGAFYGPKLDIVFTDALKREWQLGTLQCDFNLPKVFQLTYTSKDNKPEQPVLLHRAILGSLERFMGVYIEHCSGWLPLWLSPIQTIVMNLSKESEDFSKKFHQQLQAQGVRSQLDVSAESLGYKIRNARNSRIPYMIIIGKKEVESNKVSVRIRGGETATVDPQLLISTLKTNIQERKVGYSSL